MGYFGSGKDYLWEWVLTAAFVAVFLAGVAFIDATMDLWKAAFAQVSAWIDVYVALPPLSRFAVTTGAGMIGLWFVSLFEPR